MPSTREPRLTKVVLSAPRNAPNVGHGQRVKRRELQSRNTRSFIAVHVLVVRHRQREKAPGLKRRRTYMTCCCRPVSTLMPAAARPCVARCHPPVTPPPLPLQLSYVQFVAAGWLQTVSDVPCCTCAVLVLDCRALDWNLFCCTTCG